MNSRAIFLLSLVALACGCTSIVNIKVDDSQRFDDVEVSFPFPGDDSLHLRARGSRIGGNFSQTLDSGERINVEGEPIRGPAEIDGDYDLTYWSLAVGFGSSGADLAAGQSRTTTYIGLGATEFELLLDDGGRLLSIADDEPEFYLQYQFVQAITDSFNFGFGAAAGLTSDFDGSREYELFVEYEIFRRLLVTGGYRWFDYFYFSDESDSDIEVDLHGPFSGLKLPL